METKGIYAAAASGMDGVLMALEHPEKQLHQEAVVLLSAEHLDDFLLQVSTNTTLKLLVKGILVNQSGNGPTLVVILGSGHLQHKRLSYISKLVACHAAEACQEHFVQSVISSLSSSWL